MRGKKGGGCGYNKTGCELLAVQAGKASSTVPTLNMLETFQDKKGIQLNFQDSLSILQPIRDISAMQKKLG